QAAADALMVDPALQIALRSLLRCALEISLRLVVLAYARKRRTQVMQRVAQALGVDSSLGVALLLRFHRAHEPGNGFLVLLHLHQARADLVEADAAALVVDRRVDDFLGFRGALVPLACLVEAALA